ncbi:MAG: transketolase [Bdellovibrionaceae bacterium]|nr:transketolase [Pseudobdellovibrionaceae bacterium]
MLGSGLKSVCSSVEFAKILRVKCLELCFRHKASHLGGALSVADLISVLYFSFLNVRPNEPEWKERDRLFYSKGHACTALYSALEMRGFFENLLESFTVNESVFTSHVNHKVPGIEFSTGSLGHALPVSIGVALSGKKQSCEWSVVTIVSDGELDEGSNWEGILFAPHHKLDNLILIVDFNKIQSFGTVKEVLDLGSLPDKFKAFNWNVFELDGHNHFDINKILLDIRKLKNGLPSVIISHTIKGKGVSFMENSLAWHYKSPNPEEFALAMKELNFL